MTKLLAERRPAERERVKHFKFVLLADSYDVLNGIVNYIIEREPARPKDTSQRRFFIRGHRIYVRDDEDAMIMSLKFDMKVHNNPNNIPPVESIKA